MRNSYFADLETTRRWWPGWRAAEIQRDVRDMEMEETVGEEEAAGLGFRTDASWDANP